MGLTASVFVELRRDKKAGEFTKRVEMGYPLNTLNDAKKAKQNGKNYFECSNLL